MEFIGKVTGIGRNKVGKIISNIIKAKTLIKRCKSKGVLLRS